MLEVEGMNMLEEHDYSSNHRLEEEGMNMVEERPSNHRPEDEGMVWCRSACRRSGRRWRI
jgi:hypothetical protein